MQMMGFVNCKLTLFVALLADPLERSVAVIGWNCCVGIARAI